MARVIDCPKDTITVNFEQDKQAVYIPFKFYLQKSFAMCEEAPRGLDAIVAAVTLKKKLADMKDDDKALRLEESEYNVLMFAVNNAFDGGKWKLPVATAIKESGYYDAVKNAQEILVPVEK